MKELSIKEKAKAYDEAINKAKSKIKNDKDHVLYEDDIIEIFPELKESEDERMKSAAIEFVIQNKSFNYYLGISKDNVVTWINRQGEQKAWTEEDKNMLKWVIGYLENKMLNTPISEERTACKNAIAWLEEKLKGEQEPNPCDGCVNRKGCINCENGELRETEQKPADEVEPKFKVGDTMRTLQEAKDGWTDGMPFVVSIDSEYYNCNSEKIAIKDQDDYEYPPMNRRQKPAWSEEDERFLNVAINILNSSKVYTKSPDKYEDTINWLKSLKDRVQPQSQWRPSDEQMKTLEESIIFLGSSCVSISQFVLNSLYNDLQKLKG